MPAQLHLQHKTSAILVSALMSLGALPACAFNLPQPIKHNEDLQLTAPPPPSQSNPDGTAPAAGTTPPVDGSTTSVDGSPPAAGGSQPSNLLRLREALNIGLVRSPRVAAVRAQLAITRANYAQASQLPNPVLLSDSGYIAEQNYRFGVQSVYEPPWKIAFRLLTAKRQMKEQKLEILNTLWLFRNDIRRTFTEVVVAQESYQTLQDLASLSAQLLSVAQRRFTAGDVPELDVLKARLAVSQTQIDLEQGRRRVVRGKQQLNVIIGSNLDQPLSVPRLPPFKLKAQSSELLPNFLVPVPPLHQLVEQALANRLELRITKQQIAVAQAQLYSAVGNIIPDPVLGNGRSSAGNPATGPKLIGFFVSMNFELPLLTFSQGDIARLKATIKQYYQQYHAQENQITGEVASAYNNLMAARERIATYHQHMLSDSEEVAQLARLSYQVGQSDITATLAAQQANVQTRSQYLDAVTAYGQAITDLEQALGEPLQ